MILGQSKLLGEPAGSMVMGYILRNRIGVASFRNSGQPD